MCLADIAIIGARKGHSHRPPCGAKLPRGRGKGEEGEGDHSVRLWELCISKESCANTELQ